MLKEKISSNSKRSRLAAAGLLVVGALFVVGTVMAQPPTAWGRGGLRGNQILRVQYFTAPYDGWYCVRTVSEDGDVRGWRQYDDRRSNRVSGHLGIPGLMSLQAGLTMITPSSAPPARTAPGNTRMRMLFRTPAGRQRREYAGRIPAPVRAVVNTVDGALGRSGGCRL